MICTYIRTYIHLSSCPTCLSADGDEFVFLLAESILPQHGGKRSGGGGEGEAVWAAIEGLLPSDQALALYASKVRTFVLLVVWGRG